MHSSAQARHLDLTPRLPAEERERRRLIVSDAHHSNRMEGLTPDPAIEHIFDAFIAGEIEADQIVPRLRDFHARK